jgi:uncharacterized protein
MARVFLRARWEDLIIASYTVDPRMLEERLPPGTELDLFEGQAACSLVGFRFLDTRVLGINWPGYRDFPEINLRFYVREIASGRRGVVFVRELVKHRFVAWVARGLYNEPYVHAQIAQDVSKGNQQRSVEYSFQLGSAHGSMQVVADDEPLMPTEDSKEHWFKEHQWGFGTTRSGKQIRYEVQHPFWRCYPVQSSNIDVDWGGIYGNEWASMADASPISVVLAEGSEVQVYGAQTIAL